MNRLTTTTSPKAKRTATGAALLAAAAVLAMLAYAPVASAQAATEANANTNAELVDKLLNDPTLFEDGNTFDSGLSGIDPEAIRILLSPALETTLVAQMMGRIQQLDVGLGSEIEKDNTLVLFDCVESQARLDMAKAEYDGAHQNLRVKTNLRKLDAAGDAEVAIANAEARRTKASIDLSKAQLALCEIKAPFDGRVAKIYVKQFQGVNVGDPLIDIVSAGPLKIRLNVPSTMLKSLRVGAAFTVHVHETDTSYPATVTAINSRIDAVARSIELEGQLDDSFSELLPGMSGIALFAGAANK